MTARPTPTAQDQMPDASYAPPAPPPTPETRGGRLHEFMIGLPVVNRVLLLVGAVAAILGLLGLVARPVLGSVLLAIQPYTASGKQDICLNNVRSLAQAVAMYSSDHNGFYPPLEYKKGAKRTTWVTLLRDRTDKGAFLCPIKGVSDAETQSSYALNPVLKADEQRAVNAEEVQPETIILADRGDEHDVSLFPPLPGWRADEPSTSGGNRSQDLCNITFNHSGTATVLFADGHAASKQSGSWLQDLNAWGGALAVQQSAAKLKNRHPVLQEVQASLDSGDESEGSQVLARSREQSRAGLSEVLALWKVNTGDGADAEAEKWGWQLARLWKGADEKEMASELEREQTRRSQAELSKVQSGAWEEYFSDLGFLLQRPAGWTVEVETEGKYSRTFFRCGSPHISVEVEKGQRDMPGPESVIEWSGMERDQVAQEANRYKRIQFGSTTLADEDASLWAFEVEQFGKPRLRKLYIGRSHISDSYVVVCTAPASDWSQWQPVFDKIVASLRYVGE